MRIRNPGLQFYVNHIRQGRPCSFVRFGDGEWTAGILRDRSRTTSRSQSLDILGLQRDMRRAFTECHLADNYFPSLRPTSLKPRITNFLKKNVPRGVIFHDCRVFYLSSAHGKLFPLVEALRNLKIPLVFVGPPRHHLLRLSGIFPNAEFIKIAQEDCYVNKKRIKQHVIGLDHPAFISFSAGPAAKIMIHELYPLLGDKSFLFDFGSLWDVYVGHITRNYHKHMKFTTIQRNLLG